MKKLLFIIISLILCFTPLFAGNEQDFFSPDLGNMNQVDLNDNLFQLGLEAVITDICPSAVLFVGNNDYYIAGYLSPQTRFDYCQKLEPGTLPAIKIVSKDFAINIAKILDDTSSVTAILAYEDPLIMMITMFTPYEGIVFEPPVYVEAKRSLEQEAVRHGLKASEFWSTLEESGVTQKNAVYTVINGNAKEKEIVEDVLRIRMEKTINEKQIRIDSIMSEVSGYLKIFSIIFLGIIILISIFTFVSYRADRKSFMIDYEDADYPADEKSTKEKTIKEKDNE